jgi:flagella basal body P-ring formation protein FlgA
MHISQGIIASVFAMLLSSHLSAQEQGIAAHEIYAVAETALLKSAEKIPNFKSERLLKISDISLPCEKALNASVDSKYTLTPQSRIAVPVNIYCGDKRLQTRQVWFSATAINAGLVFASSQKKGDLLESCKLHQGEVDLLRGATVNAPADADLKKMLKKDVVAGAAYSASLFESRATIHVGDHILARLRNGTIQLQMPAQAISSANIGEKIKIRIQSPAQVRVARVISSTEVHIE